MDYKLTDNREEGATTTVSQSFDYDEENRVARITENYHSTDEYSYKDNGTEIYTFDYTIANEVSVRTTDEAERLLYKISAKTDAKGRITETSSYDYDNGTPRLEGQETYTYTPEGRLSSLLSKYSYSSSSGLNQYSENKFYYTDGLLTRTPTTTVTRPPTTRTTSPGSIRSRPMSATPTVMPTTGATSISTCMQWAVASHSKTLPALFFPCYA